ncbi:MAG: hypothetical protein KAJ01_04815 [Candidatus Hydrogenedentes bacterium]|nr:hypothetical protein [Candidatus Hydrogenedentota bacterium]
MADGEISRLLRFGAGAAMMDLRRLVRWAPRGARPYSKKKEPIDLLHYEIVVGGKSVKRKANLYVLLDALERGGPKESSLLVRGAYYRGDDVRWTVREASREARGFLELYAKLSGQMVPELDLQLVVDLVVKVLRPHPQSLRKVPEGLRQANVSSVN